MPTAIKFTPPVSNAYLGEIVPFYTNNGATLDLLLLWNVGNGSVDAPLQILQYNASTNSFFDDTSNMISGPVPIPANPRNVTVVDFDGPNGNPSFIIANQGLDASPFPGATDTLLLSTSSGKLIDASANLPQTLAFTHDVSSGVINQTGNIGVYFNNIFGQSNTPPYYLISNDSGIFANESGSFLPAKLQSNVAGIYTASALVDVNGDGLADLIVGPGDQSLGLSLVYLNPGNGNFSNVTPIALPPSPLPTGPGLYGQRLAGPVILDIQPIHISSPSYDDLVVVSTTGDYEGYAIQVLINDGTGHFTDQTATRLLGAPSSVTYPLTATQDWVVRTFIVDLGNGAPDIVTQAINGAPSQVFLNDGNGHFHLIYSVTNNPIKALATIGGVPTLIESNGTLVPFAAPEVIHQTTTQTWLPGQTISFTLPSNTFTDPSGQGLTYTATGLDGTPLPNWLSFNASTEAFSGTVPNGAQIFTLAVTATNTLGLQAVDNFTVNTPIPAVAVEASMYGAVGSSAEITKLVTQFLPAQVANAIANGFNPLVYACDTISRS